MWTCFRHSFLVADKSNQSTSYAANFRSCFLGFVFARWSSAFRTSLFLMFEVVDNTDDNFDIADNEDGNDAKKKSVDDWEDTVKGVKNKWRWLDHQWRTDARGHSSFFFWSFQRWLTDLCLFEGGFVVLCHGCDECWSCYFKPEWRVSETCPKLGLGLHHVDNERYHILTKEQYTKTNIWIFGQKGSQIFQWIFGRSKIFFFWHIFYEGILWKR